MDIRKDIKCYQDTLSYALSKVNYIVGENIYMLPSDMNLKIKTGTVGYNNKIFVSDHNFSLGKNEKVNAGLAKSEEETTTKQKTTTIQKVVTKAPQAEKPIITHEEKRTALILFLLFGLFFDKQRTTVCKILCNVNNRQNLIHFCKPSFIKSYVTLHYMIHVSMNSIPQYAKSHVTYVIVYVPMNLSSRFWIYDS